MIKAFFLNLMIAVPLTTIGFEAQALDKGFIAYMLNDFSTALSEWRKQAELGNATAQTNIGNCADVVAGAGSTLTGQSGFETSGTMAAGIATCKIIALYDAPDNAFGANAIMEVTLCEHLLGTNIAGI